MCVLELSPMGSGVELFVARATFAYGAILKHFVKNVNTESKCPLPEIQYSSRGLLQDGIPSLEGCLWIILPHTSKFSIHAVHEGAF